MANPIIAARLEVVAAKARILAEKYKNGQLWDNELKEEVRAIEGELAQVLNEQHSSNRGWQGDR